MGVSASGIDPFHKGKKNQYRDTEALRRQGVGFASPDTLLGHFGKLYPEIYKLQEFDRRRAADASALGERRALDANQADMARRGMSGSGLDYWTQRAIQGGRQAQLNEANVRGMEAAMREALGAAERTQGLSLQALLGLPVVYRGGPGSNSMLGADSFSYGGGVS